MAETLRSLAIASATCLSLSTWIAAGCATSGEDEGNPRNPQPDGGFSGSSGSGGFSGNGGSGPFGDGGDCPPIGDGSGRRLQLSPCPPRAGESVHVSGSGWPAQASLDLRFCAPTVVPNVPRTCPWSTELSVAADGTFSTEFQPRSFFPVSYGATAFNTELMVDCGGVPGACTVEVRDVLEDETRALS
ncbi:MAG TPA: hypothetical protein VK524_26835, partial [Polyangiaceae bacterium]|nr:hypothetical protein [Polyangiaceae bacterium]